MLKNNVQSPIWRCAAQIRRPISTLKHMRFSSGRLAALKAVLLGHGASASELRKRSALQMVDTAIDRLAAHVDAIAYFNWPSIIWSELKSFALAGIPYLTARVHRRFQSASAVISSSATWS